MTLGLMFGVLYWHSILVDKLLSIDLRVLLLPGSYLSLSLAFEHDGLRLLDNFLLISLIILAYILCRQICPREILDVESGLLDNSKVTRLTMRC